jgi:tetrahydromethanopterin S-methyltransferase subunit A
VSKSADILEILPSQAAPALNQLARGMELKKCRKCGCMKDALEQASRAFDSSPDPEIRALVPRISQYQAKMEPLAYDCIGCKKCWGADATIALASHFEDVEPEVCGAGDQSLCGDSKESAASRKGNLGQVAAPSWPPYPGDYVLGNLQSTVAVCTLSRRDLALRLIAAEETDLAIAGRCDTENIGVEKVVLNLLANPRIRWLVICGEEAKGHRAGDALLQLKQRGVDANMRVLESASWRPILKNLTLLEVARFREQIEVINLLGVTDLDNILATIRDCAGMALPSFLSIPAGNQCCNEKLAGVEHILAKAPKQLHLDRAGFFIVIPQPQKDLIVCEHYENSGRLAHVIEGRQAALIAATIVERGLVTQLDHAAYLGRELAKAEVALSTQTVYEQDAALGEFTSTKELSDSHNTKGFDCKCSDTCT